MPMNAIILAMLVVSGLALVQAGNLVIQPCTRETPSLATDVLLASPNFTDGETRPTLRENEKYVLAISFTAATSTAALTTKISAIAYELELPWNAINPKTCQFLTSGVCPFITGQQYTYENVLAVPATHQSISLTIFWRFKLPDKRNEVCFELPAQIERSE